jgi:hypothetical protein
MIKKKIPIIKMSLKKAKGLRKDRFAVSYEYSWHTTNDFVVLPELEPFQIRGNDGDMTNQDSYTVSVVI